MTLVNGINHVAIMTADLQRFIDFYVTMFEVEPVFREETPAFRHAILRAGASCWLHPVEVSGNAHGRAIPEMFSRGHLDHIALGAPSLVAFETIRQRLIKSGHSNGVIEDLGAFRALWFNDPDGMRGELTLITDPALSHFHAPRPIAST
jgi:catechol 2,3-dioxygenase-like lactoylglutathione lyase family enzyme